MMKFSKHSKDIDWTKMIISGLNKSLMVISSIQEAIQSESEPVEYVKQVQEHTVAKFNTSKVFSKAADLLVGSMVSGLTAPAPYTIVDEERGWITDTRQSKVRSWMEHIGSTIPDSNVQRHLEFAQSFYQFQETIQSMDNLDPITTTKILNAFLESNKNYLCSFIPDYLGAKEAELKDAVETDVLASSEQFRQMLEMVYRHAGIPLNAPQTRPQPLLSVPEPENNTTYNNIKEFVLPDNLMRFPSARQFSEFFMGYKLDAKELRAILDYLVKNSYITNDDQELLAFRLTGRMRPDGELHTIEWTCQKNPGSPKELYYLLRCTDDPDVYAKIKKFFSGLEWPDEKNEKYMARQASISFRRYLHNEIDPEVFTLNSGESD